MRSAGGLTAAAKTLGLGLTSLRCKLIDEVLVGSPKAMGIVEEHALTRRVKALEAKNKELADTIVMDDEHVKMLDTLASTQLDPPEWLTHRPSGKVHHATITAFLSDTHFDERVRASEMNGVNSYNRKIAELRLQRFFTASVKLTRDYIAGVKIDGLVLPLGGDMVTGNIHEELERTNEAPILDTCLHWAEQIAAGIEMQLNSKLFPKIFIPCVTGNHGRLRSKPQYKNRARDNYDWLIYQILAKHFRSDSRVSFMIPDGPDCYYDVYTTRNLLTHGDQFSGGSGIGGIAVPIMRGDAKKQKASTAVGKSYDIMQIGHWHQRKDLGSVLINGSLKGYDEYALGHSFDFELPQQSLWVTTPERGKTISAPIYVMSQEERKYWS